MAVEPDRGVGMQTLQSSKFMNFLCIINGLLELPGGCPAWEDIGTESRIPWSMQRSKVSNAP